MALKKFTFVVLITSLSILYVVGNSSKDYIGVKLKETKDLLSRYARASAEKSDLPGEWVKLWTKTAARHPRTISFSNQTFLIDEKVQPLSTKSTEFYADEIDRLDLASTQNPVKFIKYFTWNDLPFLLVCRGQFCTHHHGYELQSNQRIQFDGLIPENACFFTRDSKLYLVIAYGIEEYPESGATPSKIFAWSGAEMIQVDEIKSPPVRTLTTFQDDESTILVLALKVTDKVYCYVYRLDNDKKPEFVMYLTDTGPVMFMHSYSHDDEEFAVLISNNRHSSGIFWWEGTSLEKWISMPDVKPSSLVYVLRTDNETMMFIGNSNSLNIYKIEKRECVKLDELRLNTGQRITEIYAWQEDSSIMLLLVSVDPQSVYQTQMWKLDSASRKTESEESKEVWNSLEKLRDTVKSRITTLNNLKNSKWNFTTTKNTTRLSGLQKNSSSFIELDNEGKSNLPNFVDFKKGLLKLERSINNIYKAILKGSKETGTINLIGKTVVNKNMQVNELYINDVNVSYLNYGEVNTSSIVVSKIDQNFSMPLKAGTVFIDNLEVPMLCGLNSKNWLLVNDTEKVAVSVFDIRNSRISNDTLTVDSNVKLHCLNYPSTINGIEIKSFLDDIFVPGKSEVIRGNLTYMHFLRVMKLTADRVNKVSSSALITKYTNQSLDEVFMDRLQVQNLYIDKINGVPVDKAARMSRENIIQGKVTISNFVITDELEVENNVAVSLAYPTQVYDEMTILGDVYLQNLDLENQVPLVFHHNVNETYNVQEIIKNSWSKSRDQTIENPIVLEKGASIDELNCRYLNGLGEEDFIYINATELGDLENATFSHFHFNKVVNENSVSKEGIVEETPELVTFLEPVHISRLSVDNIVMSYYNGIPIESIMNFDESFEFDGITEFKTLEVDTLEVDDISMKSLNSLNVSGLKRTLSSDQTLELDSLKTDIVNMRNVTVKKVNGEDLEQTLMAQDSFDDRINEISLIVDGEVRVENNLQVEKINNMKTDKYVATMKENVASSIETKDLKSLRVKENLTVSFLNERRVDDYFDQALSKTSQQVILGHGTFINTIVNKLEAAIINHKNVSKLVYVDEPLAFYGNVTFSKLVVGGNIKTGTLKGEDISKLKRDLIKIPVKKLDNLFVDGKVFWDNESSDLNSLTYLMDNAVTKHGNQTIVFPVAFEKLVTIKSLKLDRKDSSAVFQKIKEIVKDAVQKDPESNFISIKGTKIFRNVLDIDDLEVCNNLEVTKINGFDVDQVVSQIFQKYHDSNVVSSQITFVKPVKISHLITNSSIHGVELDHLAQVQERMPEYIHFKHLVVERDISLYKLDGVNFEELKKNRVTTEADHEIAGDLYFDGPVVVVDGSFVTYVNGIKPENLVINVNTTHSPVVIHGKKSFSSNLYIEGDAELETLNDFNVDKIMSDSYKNIINNSIEVHGNLIFQDSVEALGNVTVHGFINQMKLNDMLKVLKKNEDVAKTTLDSSELPINNTLKEFSESLYGVKNHFFYLEEDETFKLHFSGVQTVRSAKVGTTTRLDVYASAPSSFCGLPANCRCRKQFVVEIPKNGDLSIRQEDSISFNFFELDGLFIIEIQNKIVSYSKNCVKSWEEEQKSEIFWMKNSDSQMKQPVAEVDGFISDAEVFRINDVSDKVYLILGIYYNDTSGSHSTDSLVYEFNMQNDEVNFVQSIKTEGPRIIHVFQNNAIVYALISCIKGKAETLLLKFNNLERKFELTRTFTTRESMLVTSVHIENQSFIVINNPDIDAVQIFAYNSTYDNFYDYQNLYFESKVTGLNVAYVGEYEKSEGFIMASTAEGWFYVYEYMYFGKFQLKSSHWVEDIQSISPFRHFNQNYLLVSLKSNSTVYKIIQQGSIN